MTVKATVTRLYDGLENLIASLGTSMDKRFHSHYTNRRQLSRTGNRDQLDSLYETDWLAGKVVDIIPNDMTREWRTFNSEDLSIDQVEQLEEEEKRLRLKWNFNMANKWARLYGTAFVVMSVDDGQEPEEPLNIDAIKLGGLKHIKPIDRHRLSPSETKPIMNPLDPDFGLPEWYKINETSVRIHASRLLRFDGVFPPFDQLRRNNYWGYSVLERLYETILNLSTVNDGTASMVYNTNVDVLSIKGLMNYLQTDEGENTIRKRFALAGQMKSFNNMLLLDAEEEFNKVSQSFAGLPDLIDRYSKLASAASDIPATRLLGTSATGLNATGEGDMKNYYDMISSRQEFEYQPLLDYFDKIMSKSLGIGDQDLSYAFNSLFQMTDKEKSEMELANAQRDQIYILNGVVPEVVVTKQLVENDVYSNIDPEFITEMENNVEFESIEPETISPAEQAPEETGETGEGGEGT